MAKRRNSEVRVGQQGRLVIPAALRETLALRPGDILIARAEDGKLVMERREHVLARVKGRFARVPREVSLVDELLADRRAEARGDEQA